VKHDGYAPEYNVVETVENNEKKKKNAKKQAIYKISSSDITHTGDYG